MVTDLLVISIFIFVFFIIFSVIQDSIIKTKRFNNGVCPNCGEFLKYDGTTTDEFQDRKYVCPNCGHSVEIENTSRIDQRYCNITDRVEWTVNCQCCKSRQYCMYNKEKE